MPKQPTSKKYKRKEKKNPLLRKLKLPKQPEKQLIGRKSKNKKQEGKKSPQTLN